MVARYTRRVTLVWALFFAVMAILSTLSFLFTSVDIWSLVIAVFVIKYIVRRRVLPDERQYSIMDSILENYPQCSLG